jgi:arginase
VAFGYDEREPSREQQRWLRDQGVRCYPANGMANPPEQAAAASAYLAGRARPLLVHFDVDVIDSTDFPLADFPHFNEGLSYNHALSCLKTFCSADHFAGLVVTEINPDHDPDGLLIPRLVGDICRVLA